LTVRDAVPSVPVIANGYVPRPVLLEVWIVSVAVEVAGFGLNDADALLGIPPMLRFTEPAKPFTLFTVIAYVVASPRAMLRDAGDADSVKSGAAPETTSVTDVV
jgi:hypothetical protein